MLKKISFAIVLFSMFFLATTQNSFAKDSFTKKEVTEIEKIVKDYLVKNPDVMIEVMEALQKNMEKKKDELSKASVKENKKMLFEDKGSPIFANPEGKYTVVEFFDYNCGFCKLMYKTMIEILDNNSDIKWVMKEVAMLSQTSEFAAKASIAAEKQGKYKEMHSALMQYKGALTKGTVINLAEKAGLDTEKLLKDAESKEVTEQLKSNMKLARNLGAEGVPMFVVGNKIIRGATTKGELLEIIKKSK